MATKTYDLPGIGAVVCTKSRRNRTIRLSVGSDGVVKVSLPYWTPYRVALDFVLTQKQWLEIRQAHVPAILLVDGQKIGKLHTLHFEKVSIRAAATARVTPTKLLVRYYPHEDVQSPGVQGRATAAALRALKKEAQVLLPPRLEALARTHGFTYSRVQTKQLKRRWGSCDTNGVITLNNFLMQLQWKQIDYVLCHELTHTEHMNHGAEFWKRLTTVLPHARTIAKEVRHIQPLLVPTISTTALEDDVTY